MQIHNLPSFQFCIHFALRTVNEHDLNPISFRRYVVRAALNCRLKVAIEIKLCGRVCLR